MSGNVPDNNEDVMVACQWAMLLPDKWCATCPHKPWKNMKTFIRHHVISSHRTKNRQIKDSGRAGAIDDKVFTELAKWSSNKSKKWKTHDDQVKRWYEVCDIIAKALRIAKPANISPEWTKDWFRKVVNGGKVVETVEYAISNDNTRREAQALLDRINDKKRTLTSLQSITTQHEQELHALKVQLKDVVHLLDCEYEFLSQIEPAGSAIPAVARRPDNSGTLTTDPSTRQGYPQAESRANVAPESAQQLSAGYYGGTADVGAIDPQLIYPGFPQQLQSPTSIGGMPPPGFGSNGFLNNHMSFNNSDVYPMSYHNIDQAL